TVASFITLAEGGFFSGTASGEKMKFFHAIKDTAGNKVAIQTGSPTNDTSGEGAYHLRDEINPNRCVKGALVMAKKWDPAVSSYAPNSASTQFFICAQPIPAYDAEGAFTVFGTVAGESFSVLDQLDEGDEILGVEIVRKSNRPYAN